jgi:hypothetical protein
MLRPPPGPGPSATVLPLAKVPVLDQERLETAELAHDTRRTSEVSRGD